MEVAVTALLDFVDWEAAGAPGRGTNAGGWEWALEACSRCAMQRIGDLCQSGCWKLAAWMAIAKVLVAENCMVMSLGEMAILCGMNSGNGVRRGAEELYLLHVDPHLALSLVAGDHWRHVLLHYFIVYFIWLGLVI